ncbi:hypothetical protein N0V84_009104 [Fusarium piperis]|uniref:PH domain-containing protein n=1 Tax=Fusarium piperis TaxID=1435070 RepID=A0A9W8W6Z5_9HYPO|nr:hypothetical protein N0V84_009104 [Fusarium piperis]
MAAVAPLQSEDAWDQPHDAVKPPIPKMSRLRSLRGKSASSLKRRAFDVYSGPPSEGSHLAQGDCYPRLGTPTLLGRPVGRRRSKSVASATFMRGRPLLSPKVQVQAQPAPPVSSVSAGARGVALFKGLAESVTGVIGGLAPRAAVGAVGNGATACRQGSSSPAPSLCRSPALSARPSPSVLSFASASSNLNLAPGPPRAPSPAIPPLPSPLSGPLFSLTPKSPNFPLSRPVSSSVQLPWPTHRHSRPQTPPRSPSRGRRRTRDWDQLRKTPSNSPASRSPATKSPLASSPILRTVPSASDIARFKSRNLLALRINTETAERVAQLEREEFDRHHQEEQEAERWADEVARLEAETDRILAEQRKRDLARIHAQLATPSPKFTRFFFLDRLPFLSRGRRSNATTSQAGTPSPRAPTIFSIDFSRSNSLEDSLSPDKMSFIEQGGKGIVPGIDAPTSASNGGERRVCVRCLSSVINLPVTPDTSPVDILYSTANLTTHDVNPKESVIIECYVELGLERRLRRYERIRDVMNSWDRDQQNSLLVVTNDISGSSDGDLDINSVPRTPTPPTGFTLQMYHSSRPGKWNKRWITLLESGQMYSSKKPDSKPSDKDSTVLCHMSDFDIYTPRESEVRRHLKAPRRFCYAVKSQQKTFVFPNGENFVHFFCAEDGKLAKRFHELVQGWRSWYLVNKKVDFKTDKAPQISLRSDPTTSPTSTMKSTSTVTKGGHRLKVSVDETPYTIGAFQPLLDMDRFDKPLEEFGKDFIDVKPKDQEKHAAKHEHKHESKPELERRVTQKRNVLTKTKSLHRSRTAPQLPQGEEFSPAGLLGQVYEEKRKIAERTPANNPPATNTNSAFTAGPSLLNGGVTSATVPQETKTETKSKEQLMRYRSRSVRNPSTRPTTADAKREKIPPPPMGQPLLNYADTFPEPPGWRERERESKGHGVKAPTGGPLISLATGGQPAMMTYNNSRSGSGLINQPRMPTSSSSSSMPTGSRPRSRSNAGMQQPSNRAPPVPPLPIRSLRREMTQPLDQSRGRDSRPREPLINRAGTMGFSSSSSRY